MPVLPGPIQAKETSPAYQLAKAEFQLSSLHLRQLINGDGDSARIAWNRQELVERRQALNSAQLADNRRGVLEFNAMLNDLPPISRLKLMNRMRRRHASASSALPTASADLVAHRDHFARQFTNDFGMAAEEPLLTRPSLLDMAREAAGIFDEAVVASAISRSPLGKAPGMTGMCAELLPIWLPIRSASCSIFTTVSKWSRAPGLVLWFAPSPRRVISPGSRITDQLVSLRLCARFLRCACWID